MLALIAFICTYGTTRIAHSKNHYNQVKTVRYLLPFACIVFGLENLFLALKSFFLEPVLDDNSFSSQIVYYILLVLQTTEIPILLLVTFDICYLIHKRRSVNFCGLFFDEGHRVIRVPSRIRGALTRNSVRILSFTLLVFGLAVNFGIGIGEDKMSPLAGKTGWLELFAAGIEVKTERYLLLSFFPEAVLIIGSLYWSAILWRYGSSSSMVVHSTCCNPWCYLFFASLVNLATQCFPGQYYPLTLNIGNIVYVFCILLLLREVDKDMDKTEDFSDFLKQMKGIRNDCEIENKNDENDLDDPMEEESIEMQQTSDINVEIQNNMEEGFLQVSKEPDVIDLDRTVRTSGKSPNASIKNTEAASEPNQN